MLLFSLQPVILCKELGATHFLNLAVVAGKVLGRVFAGHIDRNETGSIQVTNDPHTMMYCSSKAEQLTIQCPPRSISIVLFTLFDVTTHHTIRPNTST